MSYCCEPLTNSGGKMAFLEPPTRIPSPACTVCIAYQRGRFSVHQTAHKNLDSLVATLVDVALSMLRYSALQICPNAIAWDVNTICKADLMLSQVTLHQLL